MAQATYAIGSFLGGELSAFAQGRFDKPDYHTSLKVCLNAFPVEIGPWTRRPGTMHAGVSRGGAAARTVKFDFQQSNPVTLEFTDGTLRFRNGVTLLDSNDSQIVLAVSAANPAVVQTTSATNWVTGNTLVFPGASTPLLENRQFTATKIDTTHFSLADAFTGAAIDGSTLGALVAGAKVTRLQELSTAYIGGTWAALRAVQAETTDILLAPGVVPQALTVTTPPSAGVNPIFGIAAANFIDGPYLDPFTNGAQVVPGGKTGVITLTLQFQAYDATKAYTIGSFVTSSSVNYKSLIDQNVGNTPVSSPSAWAATSASAAINGGLGFLGSDIGRLVRLYSEPSQWLAGTSYSIGNIVAYNPTGAPGAETFWQSATNTNTGNPPGADLTNWSQTPSGAAIWSWGKIVSLANLIDRALAGSLNIGNMTSGGGVAAAFNGNSSQLAASSAEALQSGSGSYPVLTGFTISAFVGKNYSGSAGGGQKIASATAFPSSDQGFASGSYNSSAGAQTFVPQITFNLRGKASAPSGPLDGTLLGTSGPRNNTFSPVTVASNDTTTTWAYVWIELEAVFSTSIFSTSYSILAAISQLSFFNPTGTGSGNTAISVEILGAALLNTNPILTWRLGVYSNTTGWPTCGVYNDGRLYLGGAVGNRFDASYANGIVGGSINFAPTDQYGAVTAAHAISYTFNANGVNKILWMDPDLQGVKAGTQAGEWLIQAPTAGPISPLNITARNVTNHGSANIQPCRTEHTTVFVQRFARKLLEYFPDVFSGKFSAPNLADKAEHITSAGVAELAYTSAVTPIIWGRDVAGALFGVTYKRDSLASSQPPTFYGWHRQTLGSGRVVESICAGPSIGGNLDALTMVTNDPTSLRHVEVLTDTQNELSPLTASWFLDDAVNPTSVSSTATTFTINGLWHLNGKTVQVFAGGLDLGDPGEGNPFADFVVANGSITITFGDGISAGAGRGLFTAPFAAALPLSQIVVGFTYNSDGQVMKPITPADSGARNGPSFAKLSRGHRFGMKLVNALGLLIGGDLTKKMYPAAFKTDGGRPIAALTSFSGIHQDSLQDDYGYENGSVAWRVSRPFPATVVIVGTNLATNDQ